ncbi:hypothetical protein S83_051211, partial [Arachis hypogaea]
IVSKPLRHRSSLLHHRRSSPWLYPLSPDIKSGHGFVVGDEGYRQDSDIQKVKLSREALTQLSKFFIPLGSYPPSMCLQGMRWSTIGDQEKLFTDTLVKTMV